MHNHVPTIQLKIKTWLHSPSFLSPVVTSLLNLVLIIPWYVFIFYYICMHVQMMHPPPFFCPPGIHFHTFAFFQMRLPLGAIYFIHLKTLYKQYILFVSLCTFFAFAQHYILRCLHVDTCISNSSICHCFIIFHSMTISPYWSAFLAVGTGFGK